MVVAGHSKLCATWYVVPVEDAFAFKDFEVCEGDGGVPGFGEKACLSSARDLGGEVVSEYFVGVSWTKSF